MDKLHTILVLFMTYTTTLRGKHRTLTWYRDQDKEQGHEGLH